MRKKREPLIQMHFNGDDIFIICDGVKIAKRGQPNSPQAKTWVSLEPGWEVLDDCAELGGIVLSYRGATVQ